MRTWLASGLGVGTSFTSHLALTAGTTAAFICSTPFSGPNPALQPQKLGCYRPRAGSPQRHVRAGASVAQGSPFKPCGSSRSLPRRGYQDAPEATTALRNTGILPASKVAQTSGSSKSAAFSEDEPQSFSEPKLCA